MQPERLTQVFAKQALTGRGWQRDVYVHIANGVIAEVTPGVAMPQGALSVDLLLPGMSNVHAHAFQRAMAGLAETASGGGHDNFWSWREVMYRFALRLSPEQIEAVTRHFYIELLQHGYTAVGEFHYLHLDPNGAFYADKAELSHRIVAASRDAGIHLTHLPVLYETANVGGLKAQSDQRRFLHAPDEFLHLLELLQKAYGKDEHITLGVAPHSLRAIHTETLQRVIAALPGLGMESCPVHIHAAEQIKEVEDCVRWSGKRPVEWLLDHADIDQRWCLVHSTHMTAAEMRGLASSGAVAGLCPTTEANLGDGIFPGVDYVGHNGTFGIGSDSNVCVSPFEELRQLEYAQRLDTRQRTVLAKPGESAGHALYTHAASGGAQALGIRAGAIAPGMRADLAGYALEHPLLAGKIGDTLLDTLIFGLSGVKAREVIVAGEHVVKQGMHASAEPSARAFAEVLKSLSA